MMSETHELGELFGATARTDATGYWELAPSPDMNKRMYSEGEMRDLYDLLDEQFGDSSADDSSKDECTDEDDSGPATELLTNLEFDSMNTRPIEVDGRPFDGLFADYGRVMTDNDRDHDRVVTMSDVDAEVQSLAERVTELESGQKSTTSSSTADRNYGRFGSEEQQ